MSTNLFWQLTNPKPEHCLPKSLKYALGRKLWGHDGTLSGDPVMLLCSDLEMLGFLEGLEAAGVEGAAELLGALQEHFQIEVWIE